MRTRCFDAVPGLKNAAKSAPELVDVELKRPQHERHQSGTNAIGNGIALLAALLMVSGFVERLILIDKGDNSTESQYYLDLEKRLSLQFSIAGTVVLLSIFACCGRRVP